MNGFNKEMAKINFSKWISISGRILSSLYIFVMESSLYTKLIQREGGNTPIIGMTVSAALSVWH